MSRQGWRVLIGGILGAVFGLAAAFFIMLAMNNREAELLSVSTDKSAYEADEPVHIFIENFTRHAVNIYCPAWCALGNFPTQVERYREGGWEYFLGFCPSIEPLFGSGTYTGKYIRHQLGAGEVFELAISGFESAELTENDRLRIVYYVGFARRPVYSNEFTVGP